MKKESSPIPTLARGVAKRIAREAGFDMDAPELAMIKKGSRKHWIRQTIDVFVNQVGDWFVGAFQLSGNPKKPVIFLTALAAFEDERDVGLGVCRLDSRNFAIDVDTGSIVISQHAIERMCQRLKTGEPKEIAATLAPAVRLLILSQLENEGEELFVPTTNGVMLGNKEDGMYVLKTFVDDAKLRPEQVKLKQCILDSVEPMMRSDKEGI